MDNKTRLANLLAVAAIVALAALLPVVVFAQDVFGKTLLGR